jgi:ClpP class serine protease
MSSWNEIFESIQPMNTLEKVKKEIFNEYISYTNRNIVVYYSCWQQKPGIPGPFSIDDDDRNGFINALYNLDKVKGLDLILHTPGGDMAATQSIVEYIYKFFSGDIRVIIPHTAMSAGTMIACSSKEIIMGSHSNLGPIDPQIANMPAHEFIKMLKQAQNDLQ